LAFFAKKIIKKYKPKIIGITGSVGKTTAKEAIFAVLKNKFNTRQNIKNYNTEFGLPLTIIGSKTAGKNLFLWILVFFRAIFLILFRDKNYPEILVLEMGADHPGDIQHLVKIAPPDIAIVTAIGATHLEFFGTVEKVNEEEAKILSVKKENSLAVLNCDDENIFSMRKKAYGKVLTVGFAENADIMASDFSFDIDKEKKQSFVIFKLHYNGSIVPVKVENVLSITHIYPFLFAIAVGLNMGISLMEAIEYLKKFQPPSGRMNLLQGIKNSQIIDDTYNSSPKAVISALNVLREFSGEYRRIAVLGDMLELGAETEKEHRAIGKKVAQLKIDLLFAVGEKSKDYLVSGAIEGCMDENKIFRFDNSEIAGKFLQEKIKQNDLILIKGSQGIRMEKIVKEIMAEPTRAKELLVRQDEDWI
jgi:UDP-N-acetylmuramoyl-tripeptide--D-alanyl-D-alanine ligase